MVAWLKLLNNNLIYTNVFVYVKTDLIRIDLKFLMFSGIGTSASASTLYSLLTITIGSFPIIGDVI
jgi:hypothetical protein